MFCPRHFRSTCMATANVGLDESTHKAPNQNIAALKVVVARRSIVFCFRVLLADFDEKRGRHLGRVWHTCGKPRELNRYPCTTCRTKRGRSLSCVCDGRCDSSNELHDPLNTHRCHGPIALTVDLSAYTIQLKTTARLVINTHLLPILFSPKGMYPVYPGTI